MSKLVVLAAAIALLAGCGSAERDRALSGAGIGAAGGLVFGPVGVLLGAATGAATGALTEKEDVYLGEPAWKRK